MSEFEQIREYVRTLLEQDGLSADEIREVADVADALEPTAIT